MRFGRAILLMVLVSGSTPLWAGEHDECRYRYVVWNTRTRVSSPPVEVRKPYSAVSGEERDTATGCTVCERDQAEIRLPGLKPFRVCQVFAERVRDALEKLLAQGEPITEVEAYRVVRSRGSVNERGERTGFSNHSFGIAIDINPPQNGLYHRCVHFGPHCQLVRGGPWRPGQPGSLTADGRVVQALKDIGLRWGGEIAGKQKDFMHFSPTGY